MASQAFRVVRREVMFDLLMRIVACKTADPRVIAHKTLAVCQPIGLEAHIRRSVKAVPHRRVPGSMTLSAEIACIFSIHGLERLWQRGEVTAGSVSHVASRAGVTALASNSGAKILQIQFFSFDGVGCVATETLERLPHSDLPAECFRQVLGDDICISRRRCKSLFYLEIADKTFIKIAISFQDPGLGVLAKDPANGDAYRVRAVGHAVRAAPLSGPHRIKILALLNAQVWMRLQDGIRAWSFQCVMHGCKRIGRSNTRMTVGAGRLIYLRFGRRRDARLP